MKNKDNIRENAFLEWVEGERPPQLRTERISHQAKQKQKREYSVGRELQRLFRFLRHYKFYVAAICILLSVVLVAVAINLPEFGNPENPTNNEVVERYISSTVEETGAENVIAGLILNYRGFDTFGEACVLFLAVCSVMLLMGTDARNTTPELLAARRREEALERQEDEVILRCVSRILIPCVLVFGLCSLLNGHVSPGGGFSGGAILGAALILYAVAFGNQAVRRFFPMRVYNIVRISGLCIYAGLFGTYIFLGANGIESDLAHYIVLVIDVAVGLVVMSTIYGFYSFYMRGEL